MRRWIVTFGGAGLVPYAPGTVASLLACALLYGGYLALGGWDGRPNTLLWQVILLTGVAASSALSVALGRWACGHFARKDPPPFVLDEVAGICLSWLGQPMYVGRSEFQAAVAVFIAFRLFDILKPPPARQLERLPQGWGILMDDLAAAIYANLLCQLVLRLAIGS